MSSKKPKVRNTIARNIFADLQAAGQDTKVLLTQAGITSHALKDEDGWLAYESHAKFLEAAADVMRDPYFGLHLAARVEPREFGALAYIGLSSRTLEDALHNLQRYLATHTEAFRIKLRKEEARAVISIAPSRVQYVIYPQAAEVGVGLMVRAYQYFLGQPLKPLAVNFVHELKDGRETSEIASLLACDVSFGRPMTEIVLDRKALAMRIGTWDDHLLKILKAHCDHVLQLHKTDHASLKSRVNHAIADLLPSGRAKAKLVAKELGMTERTLHRRLAREKTSFGEIQDSLRSQLAQQYLSEKQLTVKQVAFLLGYADQSAFGVAFRRWTGRTPRTVRSSTTTEFIQDS